MENKLREARKASGKTQAEVAKAAGVAEAMYQRYEYGWNIPRADKAVAIAEALGTTVEHLFSRAGKEQGT